MKQRILLSDNSVEVTPTTVLVNGTRFPLRNITSVSFVDLTRDLKLRGHICKWCCWLFALPGLCCLPLCIIEPKRILDQPVAFLFLVGMSAIAFWLGKHLEKSILGSYPYACEITSGNQAAALYSHDRTLVERVVASINDAIDTAAF